MAIVRSTLGGHASFSRAVYDGHSRIVTPTTGILPASSYGRCRLIDPTKKNPGLSPGKEGAIELVRSGTNALAQYGDED
jgi:hypothetical protein